MICPFLKETAVQSCQIAPVKKVIPQSSISEESQRCSSCAYEDCPVAQGQLEGKCGLAKCPYSTESMVQYCSAQASPTYVPFNSDLLSRCNSDAHRYCALYLQRAYPQHNGDDNDEGGAPSSLAYSTNHMWLETAEDGTCHIGVDAFLAEVIGEVESSVYLTEKGFEKPGVVLKVGGVDLPLTFPYAINVTGYNYQLRSKPEIMIEDPYGSGWLFEGLKADSETCNDNSMAISGLMTGETAQTWQRSERDRMTTFVHNSLARCGESNEVLVADGGVYTKNLAKYLPRNELLQLFNLFFTHS